MLQMLKKRMKEQKGFTLIELLAVIVILGIIAAIAVPSVLNIISNSKKDAHVANAQQMINAGRMLIASESTYQTGTHYVTLKGLEDLNMLDPVDSPDNPYEKGSGDTASKGDPVSYVELTNGKVTGVKLVTSDGTAITKIDKSTTAPGGISTKDIGRSDVQH